MKIILSVLFTIAKKGNGKIVSHARKVVRAEKQVRVCFAIGGAENSKQRNDGSMAPGTYKAFGEPQVVNCAQSVRANRARPDYKDFVSHTKELDFFLGLVGIY
jgi:hypothetical protein